MVGPEVGFSRTLKEIRTGRFGWREKCNVGAVRAGSAPLPAAVPGAQPEGLPGAQTVSTAVPT